MAVVYRHTNRTTGEPFYIGIGATEKRAFSDRDRNKYWKAITCKYGYQVEILYRELTWEEACLVERKLISEIGRRDRGKGPLINLTDGGEGTLGAIRPQERTLRIIESKKKNGTLMHSQETRNKISAALKGKSKSEEHKKNNSLCRIGVLQSEESNKKRSQTMIGLKRPLVVCPHCSKVGAINGMKRYHFENCKLIVG